MNLIHQKSEAAYLKENDLECLHGVVQKIIFSNEENGYAVLSVAEERTGGTETVVGTLALLNPGETIKFYGSWVNNVKFGRQFKCQYHEVVYPGTEKGLIHFLSSGFIPGIGPTYAERIVKKFGMKTIDILSHEPDQLLEVSGIGEKRIKEIKESWEKHRAIRDVMVFLQGYDISAAYATKIYRVYHHRSVEKIRENPYNLATDVPGIGFVMADRIARKMGFP
ncbi:MAG: ATP-dependent RecD-like DNA helicase, partial [Candidatus Aureabacteria bacterium]|nr:ATP-dependent RecD-like DNA helicase [Candidatus Auribacterota bacterium]